MCSAWIRYSPPRWSAGIVNSMRSLSQVHQASVLMSLLIFAEPIFVDLEPVPAALVLVTRTGRLGHYTRPGLWCCMIEATPSFIASLEAASTSAVSVWPAKVNEPLLPRKPGIWGIHVVAHVD